MSGRSAQMDVHEINGLNAQQKRMMRPVSGEPKGHPDGAKVVTHVQPRDDPAIQVRTSGHTGAALLLQNVSLKLWLLGAH